MYCPHCGEFFEDGMWLCAKCHQTVASTPDNIGPMVPWVHWSWFTVPHWMVMGFLVMAFLLSPSGKMNEEMRIMMRLASGLGMAAVAGVIAVIVVAVKRREVPVPLAYARSEIGCRINEALVGAVLLLGAIGVRAFLTQSGGTILVLEVAGVVGLAYGVYRRSRVCAALLFAYGLLTVAPSHTSWPMLLCIPLWYGIVGTFRHHRLLSLTKEASGASG